MTALGAWTRSFVILVAVTVAPSAGAQPKLVDLAPAVADADRTVFRVHGPVGDDLIEIATNLAASGHRGVLLLDDRLSRDGNERFLEAYKPTRIAHLGQKSVPKDPADVDFRGLYIDLRHLVFPAAGRVVVAPKTPRRLLVQSAALAIAARAPMFVRSGTPGELGQLQSLADRWQSREILWVEGGDAASPPEGFRIYRLADEAAVLSAAIDAAAERGRIDSLVLTNPADAEMSSLAPWVTSRRNAVLLLTNDSGTDASAVVGRALARPALATVEYLLIVGSPAAIPPERRPNPIVGKDEFIEMEPFTPAGHEPFTLATGRLFHADPGVVALQLARARLLPADGTPRRALVASNPGGSLPLLETCSRASAAEMANRGYEVTPLFGHAVNPKRLRDELPRHDLVLWEGHHNTLINDWKFPAWDEPLPPSFVFLQSCLALTEEKATPLLARGSVAVLGSSSRIYSATGGAFSGAYLDAVMYDRQSLGGALRQAKNFLAAYGELKEKRLDNARLTGANLRSAWAFTLWGDPAVRLPAPPVPSDAKPAVRCVVNGDAITVYVPESAAQSLDQPSVARVRYEVPFRPNARLAGLVRPTDVGKLLVPLVFAEVPLPHGPVGATPRLVTKLGDSQWVFLWDARRRVGSLLAMPKTTGEQVMKFRVEWNQIAAQN